MRIFVFFLTFVAISLSTQVAFAVYTEVGVSYSYKKTSFSENDTLESQSTTASVSFYIWERIALELSYTDGLAVRKESPGNTFPSRETTQNTTVIGSDLIFGFADRKALIQPYVKGGVAHISKRQSVQDEGYAAWEIKPDSAYAPSYGFGIRIMLTESLSIKASYDAWRTPVQDGVSTTDSSGRVGVSWVL